MPVSLRYFVLFMRLCRPLLLSARFCFFQCSWTISASLRWTWSSSRTQRLNTAFVSRRLHTNILLHNTYTHEYIHTSK